MANDESDAAEDANLTTFQKVMVGGLGGTMPGIAVLAAGEYNHLLQGDVEYITGYCVRLVLFFFVGAIVVWLHADIRRRYAAFQLGLTAPALIASMLGTAAINTANAQTAFGPEILTAQLDQAADSTVMSDELPFTVVFGNCSVVDGILGRKC